MPDSDWTESTVLAEWAENECRHLDLVASWETLLSVYETLGFIGPDSDEMRLVEFKTIITEINKFLTRMKNGLAKAKSIDDAVAYLSEHSGTSDMNSVRSRTGVAYNKLKQRWIMQSISVLLTIAEQSGAEEGERDAKR